MGRSLDEFASCSSELSLSILLMPMRTSCSDWQLSVTASWLKRLNTTKGRRGSFPGEPTSGTHSRWLIRSKASGSLQHTLPNGL